MTGHAGERHGRSPLIIDTIDLGRRAGSERDFELQVPAPPDLGVDVIGVPEGSDLDLFVRLEAVLEGVLATVDVHADLVGECVRCLEPLAGELDVDFAELYTYEDARDADVNEEDDEVSVLDGDLLDLEPPLRGAVVLALPLQPLCTPDCLGLCPECGFRLNDDPAHSHEAPIDPRWAVLGEISAKE